MIQKILFLKIIILNHSTLYTLYFYMKDTTDQLNMTSPQLVNPHILILSYHVPSILCGGHTQ